MSLSGKNALVTGASSGIGRAIAVALAEAGVNTALLARSENTLRELSEDLAGRGVRSYPFAVDLTETGPAQDSVNMAASALGGLDILINAAGLARQSALSDGNPEDWRAMMELNVYALSVVTREALPHFPESGGHVIHLCSMSGHRVPGKGGFYSATKFAVRAMTEGLRQELRAAGNLTRVGCISPGFVDTPLLDEYFANSGGDDAKHAAVNYPILQPKDVAELVLHQLSLPATAEVTDILVRPTHQRT